ncbi:hypothetical protein J6590_089797 [Homalodisca vitripennis]|nr:hypothetical protein J6590_089797 [Homalodisca vitripennis]
MTENALCTVRDRCSPWCVGLTPTKNLPVQALETLSGTHLCNYFKRHPLAERSYSAPRFGTGQHLFYESLRRNTPDSCLQLLLSVFHLLHLKKVWRASSESESPYWYSGLGIFPILLR